MPSYINYDNPFNLPKDQYGVGMGTGYLGGIQQQYQAAMMERGADADNLQQAVNQLKYKQSLDEEQQVGQSGRDLALAQNQSKLAVLPSQTAAETAKNQTIATDEPIKARAAQRGDQEAEILSIARDIKSDPQTYNPLNQNAMDTVNARLAKVNLPPTTDLNKIQMASDAIQKQRADMASAPKIAEEVEKGNQGVRIAKATGEWHMYDANVMAQSRVQSAEIRSKAAADKFSTAQQALYTMIARGQQPTETQIRQAAMAIVDTEFKEQNEYYYRAGQNAAQEAEAQGMNPNTARMQAMEAMKNQKIEAVTQKLKESITAGQQQGQGASTGPTGASTGVGIGSGLQQGAAAQGVNLSPTPQIPTQQQAPQQDQSGGTPQLGSKKIINGKSFTLVKRGNQMGYLED